MRLLVFVFAASFLVLLLAFWGVLRVVRRHASKQAAASASLRPTDPPHERELEQDAPEE